MATGTAAATAAQMGGGVLSSEMSSSPQSGATAGDARGGTTGNFSFGNVNFSGTQSNSAGVNWLLALGIAGAALLAIYLLKK